MNPNSITKQCACAAREFNGRHMFVVDTPGFFDTRVELEEDIKKEVAKAYQVTALPGPHAFLLIIEPKRFTVEESQAIDNLRDIFGLNALKHTIIVFTHGDSFNPKKCTIEGYLAMLEPQSPLKLLLDQCERRYLLVNNEGTETEKTKVLQTLVDMITNMVAKNDGQVYKTSKFEEVAKVIYEEKTKEGFKPVNPDGSINLLPEVKKIVVDGFLSKTIVRKLAH
jgi:GTPase Era involved in 16S rRNA processing